jgi:hypothetical protein
MLDLEAVPVAQAVTHAVRAIVAKMRQIDRVLTEKCA